MHTAKFQPQAPTSGPMLPHKLDNNSNDNFTAQMTSATPHAHRLDLCQWGGARPRHDRRHPSRCRGPPYPHPHGKGPGHRMPRKCRSERHRYPLGGRRRAGAGTCRKHKHKLRVSIRKMCAPKTATSNASLVPQGTALPPITATEWRLLKHMPRVQDYPAQSLLYPNLLERCRMHGNVYAADARKHEGLPEFSWLRCPWMGAILGSDRPMRMPTPFTLACAINPQVCSQAKHILIERPHAAFERKDTTRTSKTPPDPAATVRSKASLRPGLGMLTQEDNGGE